MSREELWVFQERNSPHLLGFRDLGSGCPPPQEQIGKIWRCGSPVEGDMLRTFLWAIVMLSFILGVIPCQPSPTGWDLCLQIMGLGLFGGKTIAHQLATN